MAKARIILFLLILFAPALAVISPQLDWELPRDPSGSMEKPRIEESLGSLLSFPARFRKYYMYRFPLRGYFIRLNSWITVNFFGESGCNRVLLGKNGKFYTDHPDWEFFRHTKPLSEERIAYLANVLQERHEWLEDRGIKFLVTVVPESHTIYPEDLPDHKSKLGSPPLDFLIRKMGPSSPVNILDLTEAMREKRHDYPLYLRTDSHWSDLGAYVGYRATMEKLRHWFPSLPVLPMEAFRLETRLEKGGDQAEMLGLEDFMQESVTHMIPISPLKYRVTSGTPWGKTSLYRTEIPGSRLPRLLVRRDSYMHTQIPFFSSSFSEVNYSHGLIFDGKYAQMTQPDVFLLQFVQRRLMYDNFANSEGVSRSVALAREFRSFKHHVGVSEGIQVGTMLGRMEVESKFEDVLKIKVFRRGEEALVDSIPLSPGKNLVYSRWSLDFPAERFALTTTNSVVAKAEWKFEERKIAQP